MTNRRTLLTTTSNLEGWSVEEYVRPISAQIVIGTGLFAEFFSSWTDLFGAHSRSYQKKLDRINEEALAIISEKATRLGCNVVLGLRLDHDEISGGGKSMLMVTASGTAVRAKRVTSTRDDVSVPERSSISVEEMQVALTRSAIIDNGVRWDNEHDWAFVLENRMVEIASSFTKEWEKRAGAGFGDTLTALKQKFDDFFLSIPAEDAIPYLYSCAQTKSPVFAWALDFVRRYSLFDARLVLAAIEDAADDHVATHAAQFILAHQRSYDRTDLQAMETLITALESTFPEAEAYTSSGLFGKKRVWRCTCGNEIASDQQRCGCGRDRFGFGSDLVSSIRLQDILRRRIACATTLLHQVEPEPPVV